jgi:hypothetical protein
MPKIGILDQLTDGQKGQLITWLETMSHAEVLKKLSAPEPEGFGIHTYITSLRRFQDRVNREQRAELLAREPALAGAADRMLQAARDELLQHVLHLATTSMSSSPAIMAVAKILAAQQDYALRAEENNLRERALKLAEERLALERQRTAAELIIKEARIENNVATEQVQEVVENIIKEDPSPETLKNGDLNDDCDDCEGCDECDSGS